MTEPLNKMEAALLRQPPRLLRKSIRHTCCFAGEHSTCSGEVTLCSDFGEDDPVYACEGHAWVFDEEANTKLPTLPVSDKNDSSGSDE